MQKFLIVIFTLLSSYSFSQYYWDYGIMAGSANYLGELGGDEKTRRDFVMDMKVSQTRWAAGGFLRYRFNSLFSAKGNLLYGRIQGADNLSTNPPRRGRNLSFRNDMVEFSATAEVNFYQVNDVGRTGRYRVDFKSYGFLGIGGLYHNPKAEYQGQWHALRPLKTEGIKYAPVAFTIPAGAGFYYTYKKKYRIGWEIGYRTTFTDYLDDVSTNYAGPEELNNNPLAIALSNRRNEVEATDVAKKENYLPGNKRGDPTHNDGYFFTTLNFSYVLKGKRSFYKNSYDFIFGHKRKYRRKFVLRRARF